MQDIVDDFGSTYSDVVTNSWVWEWIALRHLTDDDFCIRVDRDRSSRPNIPLAVLCHEVDI